MISHKTSAFIDKLSTLPSENSGRYLRSTRKGYSVVGKEDRRKKLSLTKLSAQATRAFEEIQDASLSEKEQADRLAKLKNGTIHIRDRIKAYNKKPRTRFLRVVNKIKWIFLRIFTSHHTPEQNLTKLTDLINNIRLLDLSQIFANDTTMTDRTRKTHMEAAEKNICGLSSSDYEHTRKLIHAAKRKWDPEKKGRKEKVEFFRKTTLYTLLESVPAKSLENKFGRDTIESLDAGSNFLANFRFLCRFFDKHRRTTKVSFKTSYKKFIEKLEREAHTSKETFFPAQLMKKQWLWYSVHDRLHPSEKNRNGLPCKKYTDEVRKANKLITAKMQVALATASIGERLFFPLGTENHAMLLVFEKTKKGVIPTVVNTGIRNGGKKNFTKFVYSEMPIHTAVNSTVLLELLKLKKNTKGVGKEIPQKLKTIWGKEYKKEKHIPQHKGSCAWKSLLQGILPNDPMRWATKYAFFEFVLEEYQKIGTLEPLDKALIEEGKKRLAELQKKEKYRKAFAQAFSATNYR